MPLEKQVFAELYSKRRLSHPLPTPGKGKNKWRAYAVRYSKSIEAFFAWGAKLVPACRDFER
jgi:hypothetical protein